MRPLPPERTRALSQQAMRQLVLSVMDAGGNVPDILTVLTATAAQVIQHTLPEGDDAGAVEKLAKLIGEMMPILREMDREGASA